MSDFFDIFFARRKRLLERNLFFKLAMGCLGVLFLTCCCTLAIGLWIFLKIPTP